MKCKIIGCQMKIWDNGYCKRHKHLVSRQEFRLHELDIKRYEMEYEQ